MGGGGEILVPARLIRKSLSTVQGRKSKGLRQDYKGGKQLSSVTEHEVNCEETSNMME